MQLKKILLVVEIVKDEIKCELSTNVLLCLSSNVNYPRVVEMFSNVCFNILGKETSLATNETYRDGICDILGKGTVMILIDSILIPIQYCIDDIENVNLTNFSPSIYIETTSNYTGKVNLNLFYN